MISAALNDGNTMVDVDLNAGTNETVANAWEAAGVIFTTTKTVGTVKFVNGTWDGHGAFAQGLALQYTTNGTTWVTAATWTLSPAYPYTNTAAAQTYAFSGTPITSVKGVRVVGQVNVTGKSQKRVRVREVKAFPNSNAVGMGGRKVLAKPAQQGGPPNVCAKYGIVAANCKATSYYQFGSMRVAMRDQTDANPTGSVYWLHGDHLGSASLTTDASGGKMAEMRFKPWGEVRWSNGLMPTDRQFEGMTTHAAIGGIVTMGAREYLPTLGRWLSADTVVPGAENPQAFNRYSFVNNNPLNFIDPSGHDPLDEKWVKEFTSFHHRDPTHYDRMIRLFSLAYPDEWKAGGWDKFYTADGQLRDDATINGVFQSAPASRSWGNMPDALANLAGSYKTNETREFVRDIASLYGGMADRFDQQSDEAALQSGQINHGVFVAAGGLPERLTDGADANVHHWAFGAMLGYVHGVAWGVAENTVREFNQAAGGAGRGRGDIRTNGLDPIAAFNNPGSSADIWLGNRAALFSADIRLLGVSPNRVRFAYSLDVAMGGM